MLLGGHFLKHLADGLSELARSGMDKKINLACFFRAFKTDEMISRTERAKLHRRRNTLLLPPQNSRFELCQSFIRRVKYSTILVCRETVHGSGITARTVRDVALDKVIEFLQIRRNCSYRPCENAAGDVSADEIGHKPHLGVIIELLRKPDETILTGVSIGHNGNLRAFRRFRVQKPVQLRHRIRVEIINRDQCASIFSFYRIHFNSSFPYTPLDTFTHAI